MNVESMGTAHNVAELIVRLQKLPPTLPVCFAGELDVDITLITDNSGFGYVRLDEVDYGYTELDA